MKRLKTTICALVAAATLGLGNIEGRETVDYHTLIGKPLSVQVVGRAHTIGSLATVIEKTVIYDPEKKMKSYFICSSKYSNGLRSLVEAAAIIQAEIDDGDDEEIKLVGKRSGKNFQIYEVEVKDYGKVTIVPGRYR